MANTIYVSPAGNNSWPGTSAQPKQTIAAGWAEIQGPGDTLYVMDGTYYEQLTFAKSGISGSPITIAAAPGHTNVVIDGRAGVECENCGLPAGDLAKCRTQSDGTQTCFKFTNLVSLEGSWLVWDGIDIKRSMGRAMIIQTRGVTSRSRRTTANVTVKNCDIGANRNSNILIQYCTDITVDNCVLHESGNYYPGQRPGGLANIAIDQVASLALLGVTDVTIKNSTHYLNYGEVIITNANARLSDYVTIEDNIFYNNQRSLSVHASQYVTVQRNFFYVTDDFEDSLEAIYSVSTETTNFDWWDQVENIGNKFINNIIVNYKNGIMIMGSSGRPMQRNILVANNTAVNCGTGYGLIVTNKTGCVFKNNVATGCDEGMSIESAKTSGWTFSNNAYDSAPTYGTGTGDVTGGILLVNKNAALTWSGRASGNTGVANAANYQQAAGSSTIDAGANLSASFTAEDFWGKARSGTWDIGADERGGVTALSATAGASPTSGNAPLAVTFSGSAAGGSSPYTYAWTFGDGSTSSSQNPSHTYSDPGTFTATLTVTDNAGVSQTDTVTINVAAESAPATGSTQVEQVIFNAGATSFAVSGTPKAILFIYGGGITDLVANAASDAKIGFGIWTTGNQYAMGVKATHGQATTVTAEQYVSGKSILFVTGAGTEDFSASVSSVTSSAVNLSWSTGSASEKCVALVFYGAGVTNVTAPTVTLGNAGVAATAVSGDYNLAIMPATLYALASNLGIADVSLGFAARGGNQHCLAWTSRDVQSSADVHEVLHTDRIAGRARTLTEVQVSSWDGSGFELTPLVSSVNQAVPVLLMKLAAGVYIDVIDLPTSTASTNYPLGFTAQQVVILTSLLTGTDTKASDDTASVFGVTVVNAAGTDRTIAISDDDGASPTVSKSSTDAQFMVPAVTGTTAAMVGTASISTTNLNITLTSADSTTRKALVIAFEATSASSGPNAYFSHDADENTVYGDTITVTDLSSDDGVNALTSWAVDWGDGNSDTGLTPGASQTHVYAAQGTYTITVTATDAGAATDTYSQDIGVGIPGLTASFTVTPTSGAAPLTITLDASASTAGGNEEIEFYEWTIHNIETSDQVGTGGSGAISFYLTGVTPDDLDLPEPGNWTVILDVIQRNTGAVAQARDYVTVTPASFSCDFSNETGATLTAVGPHTVTFRATTTAGEAEVGATYEWDFGDGNTDSGEELTEVSNEYAATLASTAYDVELTVTLADGSTTDTETKVGYITIIPAPEEPPTLAELYAYLQEIAKHLGALYGVTWTQLPVIDNAYRVTITNAQWAAGYSTFVVKENGVALTAQVSAVDVDANPGSYYARYNAGDGSVIIDLHPSDSLSPATNGKQYRWTAS